MKNPMIGKEPSAEMNLWNKVYGQYCVKNAVITVYVVHGEHIGDYALFKNSYYLKPKKFCEAAHIIKIMKTEIARWENDKIPEASVHLSLSVCRDAVVIPANQQSKEFRKWFREYYFPDDFYENLIVVRNPENGDYLIWNREEEESLADYLTPEENEEKIFTIHYENLRN